MIDFHPCLGMGEVTLIAYKANMASISSGGDCFSTSDACRIGLPRRSFAHPCARDTCAHPTRGYRGPARRSRHHWFLCYTQTTWK